MNKRKSAVFLFSCIITLSAQATTLASVGLDIPEGAKTVEWVHSTLMDGSSYSWRVNIPKGRKYDGFLVGVRRPGSSWLRLDEVGRVSRDAASEALFAALEAGAVTAARPTTIQVKVKADNGPDAYYYPGWTVESFKYAAVSNPLRPSCTIIAPEARLFRQVLPDPSLLEEGRGLLVCIAMMKTGTSECEGLLLETEDEYIRGEKAFFSKPAYAKRSYAKKAAALMGSLFSGGAAGYRAALRSSYPGIAMSDADWRLFEGDPELEVMQKRLRTQLLNTMLGATDYGEYGRLFLGLDGPTWFECLYGMNRIPYVSTYLRCIFEAGMPVWAASVAEDDPGYDWEDYEPVADGAALASAALALVGEASAPAGEPLSLHGLGLLTRALASTGLRSRVEGLGARRPAEELAEALAGSPSPGEAGAGPPESPTFYREDMERIGLLLPGLDALRPGDLLLHYGSGSEADGDPPQVAIVLRVPGGSPPAPGTDSLDFLRKVVAVTMRDADAVASMGPLLGEGGQGSLFPDPLSFHARRLVVRKGAAK